MVVEQSRERIERETKLMTEFRGDINLLSQGVTRQSRDFGKNGQMKR